MRRSLEPLRWNFFHFHLIVSLPPTRKHLYHQIPCLFLPVFRSKARGPLLSRCKSIAQMTTGRQCINNGRFPLRHAARLLTTRSVSITARSRTITSFASLPARPAKLAAPVQFQRRWATGGAEAKKEEEVPVSHLQPTPEEEVENKIQEDNTAAPTEVESAPVSEVRAEKPTSAADTPIAESSNATEATEDVTTTAAEPAPVQTALDSTPSAAEVTANLTEGIAESAPVNVRRPFREPPSPKPTIYVGNLFFDVTENDLIKEFQRFGPIKKTRLVRDSRGLSKGQVKRPCLPRCSS